ncbi:hypothetical protein BR93DRAFT_922154 [Coniochaeta sp. PMI_546]|nr:hypothetical protein BR93DRAFT_922154 [Coniochaeta sp. PMI_546]
MARNLVLCSSSNSSAEVVKVWLQSQIASGTLIHAAVIRKSARRSIGFYHSQNADVVSLDLAVSRQNMTIRLPLFSDSCRRTAQVFGAVERNEQLGWQWWLIWRSTCILKEVTWIRWRSRAPKRASCCLRPAPPKPNGSCDLYLTLSFGRT